MALYTVPPQVRKRGRYFGVDPFRNVRYGVIFHFTGQSSHLPKRGFFMDLPGSWPAIVTLAVLVSTVIAFISGRIRSDVVAVCALLALMLFGVLTPQEALSGFSNPVIMILGGLFIIGGAVIRSGLANAISNYLLSLVGENHNILFMLVMLITAAVGSIVSNTGTVAMMMPIVFSMAMAINASPSRFLMPLAFMSSIGGMLTLVGNPGNMMVNDVFVKAGFESLSLFSFLPVGLVCLAFGLFVLTPATSFFLARRRDKSPSASKTSTLKELADKYRLAQNLYKMTVPRKSPLVGKTLAQANVTGEYGLVIQEIHRAMDGGNRHSRTKQIMPEPGVEICRGDVLYCVGSLEHAADIAEHCHLHMEYMSAEEARHDIYHFDSIGICELVLMSSSRLLKQTVAESGLRQQFGINLLGIQRGDQLILEDLKDQVMLAGDSLLVQGTWERLTQLVAHAKNWVVVGQPHKHLSAGYRQKKIPLVVTVLVLLLAGMTLGILPPFMCIMLAAIALVLGKCFTNMDEAASYISGETIVMIAAMLPMAVAMEKTGMVAVASSYMTSIGAQHGPLVALALIYGVTSALNTVINGTAVALLVAPVAIRLALDLDFDPLPFVYGVAAASGMCFASPFSSPANALVMSAGRYNFMDYLKIGLPLQILLGIVMVLVLPILFPF